MMGYDDKRAFYRMAMNSPCELFFDDNPDAEPIPAVCKDMSATGMSFEVPNDVPMDCLLRVTIESSNIQIASLNALVKVVRCIAEGEGYILGVEAVEMK